MTENGRSELVKKYFMATPKEPSYTQDMVTMIGGGLLALIGLIVGIAIASQSSGAEGGLCCGGIIVLAGIALAVVGFMARSGKKAIYDKAYRQAEPKPSDAQMDKWLESDKENIVEGALGKLGLVAEQVTNLNDPLVIIGPDTGARYALGKDDVIRFSKYEIVVIYLTNYHLGAYTCHLDFVTGLTVSEETQEFHYTDVVSVSTSSSNTTFTVETMDGKTHPIASHQQFRLAVASQESIDVTVAFPQIDGILKTGKWIPSGAERAVSILRTMLREKKGGV